MQIHATGHIAATDEPRFRDHPDLDVTVFLTATDGFSGADTVHIKGTPAERADFLRRLANAANNAAADLMADHIAAAELTTEAVTP